MKCYQNNATGQILLELSNFYLVFRCSVLKFNLHIHWINGPSYISQDEDKALSYLYLNISPSLHRINRFCFILRLTNKLRTVTRQSPMTQSQKAWLLAREGDYILKSIKSSPSCWDASWWMSHPDKGIFLQFPQG